jgi:anthranilate synthase component I
MTPDAFAKLAAEGFNRIPVVEEVLADLDTPLSTYLKLAGGPYSYLLESAHGGEKWGRYSIIGLPARTVLKVSAKRVTVATDGLHRNLHGSIPRRGRAGTAALLRRARRLLRL